jgi:7,8-dihydropterin-6-yl-methyl-4-(beta-D-ribofuranosyl)aminobenzene 5'-phosphate synthase
MEPELRVTVLVENRAGRDDVSAEAALSLWVEADGLRLLFDTGESGAFLSNARVLGVPVEEADALVLSHGHGDHSGGMASLADAGLEPAAYLHPVAVLPRYGRTQSPPYPLIGMPAASVAWVGSMADRLTWTVGPARIGSRIGITGAVPRTTDFEDTGGPFFVDAECRKPDMLPDDQAVWVETSKGIVVLLGCAHAGMVNTLDYIASLLGASRFHAVIGGTHLVSASEERLQRTAEALERYDLTIVAPCHCTGGRALSYLESRFADTFLSLAAGDVLEL